jgi:hypothetical protein
MEWENATGTVKVRKKNEDGATFEVLLRDEEGDWEPVVFIKRPHGRKAWTIAGTVEGLGFILESRRVEEVLAKVPTYRLEAAELLAAIIELS